MPQAKCGILSELGHTSAQLALLGDHFRGPIMRRITGMPAVSATVVTESRLMPTIALVDDDRNILTSVSIALEAEGYRIMTYTDGASALDGFRTSQPDLAILDIKMPRMDGMETLRRLRQKSDLPVIRSDLPRWRLRARRLSHQPAGSCHPRHQDAAHGRHGDPAPAAAEVRPAGDLPDLQGRRDRRIVRPQDGGRRFH